MSAEMYATASDLRKRADAVETEVRDMSEALAARRAASTDQRVNFYAQRVDRALEVCLADVSKLQGVAAELASEAAAEQPPRKVEGK